MFSSFLFLSHSPGLNDLCRHPHKEEGLVLGRDFSLFFLSQVPSFEVTFFLELEFRLLVRVVERAKATIRVKGSEALVLKD